MGRQDDRGSPESGLLLSVLGQFALRLADGPHLVVRPAGQRVLAILAVTPHPVGREWLGQQLWMDSDDQHAGSNLRAVLHRLPRPGGRWVVQADQNRLRLSADVEVDLHQTLASTVLLAAPDAVRPGSLEAAPADDAHTLAQITALEHDVLPDWQDDWLLLERERHRQLRLHALEELARRLTAIGRFALAVHAGLTAVQNEPLRESAHRALIETHLAEGNVGDALRQYHRYRTMLHDELGVRPSGDLQRLIAAI